MGWDHTLLWLYHDHLATITAQLQALLRKPPLVLKAVQAMVVHTQLPQRLLIHVDLFEVYRPLHCLVQLKFKLLPIWTLAGDGSVDGISLCLDVEDKRLQLALDMAQKVKAILPLLSGCKLNLYRKPLGGRGKRRRK